MPALVSQTPFVIRPDDALLQNKPELGRYSHELARAYAQNRFATEETLQAIGQALWQAVVDTDAFAQAKLRVGNQILPIVIESGVAAIHQLPWETLYQPDDGFLAKASGFTLSRRLPGTPPEPPPLQKGPLKVLLFTSLPDDLDAEKSRLDVEEEQAQIQEALTPAIADGLIQLEMPDDGRFNTLRETLQTSQPHLVFLSGHGKFMDGPLQEEPPYAVFQFEDDNGHSHFVPDRQIAKAFAGTQVGCVVLSACESGMGASENLSSGLAWTLSQQGLPHVIGMRESVLDKAGTLFNRAFVDAVARQEPMDVALQAGRQAINKPLADSPLAQIEGALAEQSLAQWCLPMLLSQDTSQPLLDWDFTPQPAQKPLPNETLNSVTLPPRFLGRRSELRQLKSRFRQGKLQQLLLTGPGGQGKTALAGRLAQDLRRRGYLVLAFSARPENEWRNFQMELELLLDGANAEKYTRFVIRYEDKVDKAKLLLRLLLNQCGGKLLLFFDNLESVQDEKTQVLTDARLAAWVGAAQALAGQGLILLITSRWRLPNWPKEDHWPLTHANYGDWLQMARQVLPLRFLLARDRLRQVYKTLHGNGRGLTFFAAALQTLESEEEAEFLAKLAQAKRETQTDMALAAIIEQLPPAAKALLLLLPAYQVPVPLEGIEKLGLDLPQPAADLLQRLLAVSLVEPQANLRWQVVEYQLPPLVTEWLHGQNVPLPNQSVWQTAARYLTYLHRQERRTLPQALAVHQAWQATAEQDIANRFALDWIVGRLSQAGLYETLLAEWLPTICESADLQIKGEALGQTGKQNLHLGNYGTALTYLEQSLKISREIGDKSGEGTTLNNMATTAHARGDYETALTYLEQSLKIRREIGDTAGLCVTLFNMGHIHWQNEQQQEAMSAWTTTYTLAKPMGLANVLQALESLAGQLGGEGGLAVWERLSQQMGGE
ncbi:MAG: CHAT domain-containing protein [Chloroflexi bacterium]|nr:CHAT domain-containing protein [Chloroflexota bacterium]